MRWAVGRRGGWTLILLVIPAFIFLCLILSAGQDHYQTSETQELDTKLHEIRDHLDHLKFLDAEKGKAFIELKRQVELLMTASDYSNNNNNSPSSNNNAANLLNNSASGGLIMSNLSKHLNANPKLRQSIISNLSTLNLMEMGIPNLYNFLPHLLHNPNGLTPAVRISAKHRRNLHTVIGIPTIKRPKISYLVTTLRSLLDNLDKEEKEEVLVVVMIADEHGLSEFVNDQILLLQSEFPEALDSGLVEILVPPPTYFPPDLDNIPSTFGDSTLRMKWRTKQNLDYAYLMMYCQNRARYYLQLEDDVITKPNFYSAIKQFIGKQSGVPWMLLEFSSLGFIGKLFRSTDLPVLIQFLLMFHREKPVDWLLDHIFFVKLCSPEKVQKLKERDFGKQVMHRSHSNPPANVSTSLKVYQKFSLDRAYQGETFFWGLLPQPGDWIRFAMARPTPLESYLIRTGNAEHPDDRFSNSTVEVQYEGGSDYEQVGAFSSTGTAQGPLDPGKKIVNLRILVHAESDNWVIINEIWLKTVGGSSSADGGGTIITRNGPPSGKS